MTTLAILFCQAGAQTRDKAAASQPRVVPERSRLVDGVRFQQVESEEQKRQAGSLIREYLEWLNDRLMRAYGIEFDVEAMVQSDLSDPYKFYPPYGRFYLARYTDQPAGVGCLKRLETGVGEVQRMYVPPIYRGKGIGRAIANRLIDDARWMGYRKLRLESLQFLDAAHSLYRSVGFHVIEPYADNSMESYQPAEQLDQYYSITVFMEMDL
jgi:GNAT superfamily N-acetyltransferase